MNYLHYIEPHEVVDPESFAAFCQQRLGTPMPNIKQMTILRKQLKTFFEAYPDLNYFVLCRVVDWCRAKRRRPLHAYSVLAFVRYAWRDGAIPDLDPSQRKVLAGVR